ncbi:hypothetical protein ACFY8C_13530 [Streptomyces flavochromogenes]|uniref:Uncharacterized protein n=1 Tax=Streptomyces flavochromogenes TaxID=68199 RepID=A0ABW6XPE6_9ACTN|nr:hypothetical protein [Streptomyces flavochromogenes]
MDLTLIKHAVECDDGAKRLSMRFLKDRATEGLRSRLSRELCTQISAELSRLGLTTIPRTLPTSENDFVWIIQKDSILGEITDVASVFANLDRLGQNPLPKLFDNYPNAKEGLL